MPAGRRWIASWGASPMPPNAANASGAGFDDVTIREVVFASAGGTMVRVRLTNAFGRRPLTVAAASIGLAGNQGAVASGTIRPLSFAGRPSLTIAPGAEALSDPAPLTVSPLSRLAVSIFLPGPTGPATQHAFAAQVNYLAAGDRTPSTSRSPFTGRIRSYEFLDGVQTLSPRVVLGTVLALGDSITDGVGSPRGLNRRWPNYLARRLDALPGPTLSVVDAGIGGNRVLNESPCCGLDAIARFPAALQATPGVRDVIVLEGINDIGFGHTHGAATAPHTAVSALQLVEGYEQLIALAHAQGLRIFGGTLLPFRGARYWTPNGEAIRETVNRWIRTSGAFDGVIDFADAVADPRRPERLDARFDSGDHLHPNADGYSRMAAAVNLSALLGAG